MPQYNSDLYREISQVMEYDPDQLREYYRVLADNTSTEANDRCFFLAVQLRKAGKKDVAYEVSKYLTESHASLKSYNIYLASTYDLTVAKKLDIYVLKDVFDSAWKFYADKEFEPNITATLLKCCNYLIDSNLVDKTEFDRIYGKCPESEKYKNSFIITQYFKRLIAEGNRQQVINIFATLSPKLKGNKTLLQLKKSCESGRPFIEGGNTSGNTFKRTNRITVISDSEYIQSITKILSSFSIDMNVVDINSADIIETLNQNTYKATIAIIVMHPKQEDSDCDLTNWAFILGYCVHKFSKNNMLLFAENSIKFETTPLASTLKMFDVIDYTTELDFITKLGNRGIISG